MHLEKKIIGARVGLIVDIFEKKVFRGPGNIVNWDDIPGQWHYTEEQARRLEVMDEDR